MKSHKKNRIIYIILLVAFSLVQHKTYSQPTEPEIPKYDSLEWVYINTPKGDSMEARIYYGEPPEWVAYYDSIGAWYINDVYGWTSTTKLASGTHEYNCFGYAWYVSEGGPHVWLSYYTVSTGPTGNGGDPNLQKLFDDGSYIEVTDEEEYSQFGRKVFWQFNFHSAITTNDSSYVRSKWGKMPLYEHLKTECLYNDAEGIQDTMNLHPQHIYYKLNPTITGSTSILCKNVQRTFSTDITDMPGAVFVWDTGAYLTIVDGGGIDDYFIKVNGAGTGDTYVSLELTTQTGFSWSDDKDFYTGKPDFKSISGPSPPPVYKGCIGQPYTFWADPARDPDSESTYQWMVVGGDFDYQYLYQDWATVIFYDETDYYYVMSRAYNTCGYTPWLDKNMQIMNCGYFMMYPNPATDVVTVDFIGPSEDISNIEKPSDFTVQILDYSGILHYSAKKSGDSFTIPVSNLKEGSYTVCITYGKEVENLPLIIKH